MTKVAEKRQKLADKLHNEKEEEWTVEEHTNAAREIFGTFPDPVPWKPGESTPNHSGPTVNGVPYNSETPVTP